MSERLTEKAVTIGALLDVLESAAPTLAKPLQGYDRASTVETVQTTTCLLLVVTPPGANDGE